MQTTQIWFPKRIKFGTIRGLHLLLNYPYNTNVKKMVCPKNFWMRHYSGTDWDEGIKDFLKGRIKEGGID